SSISSTRTPERGLSPARSGEYPAKPGEGVGEGAAGRRWTNCRHCDVSRRREWALCRQSTLPVWSRCPDATVSVLWQGTAGHYYYYYYLGRYSEDPSDPVEAAMQQQLDRCRRPPHRRRDVVDPHVLLVPQHHRDALSRGKSLHHRPDLAQLVALGSDLLEWRTGRGKVMLLFDVLHGPGRAVAVHNRARRDLIQPGGERPAGVVVAADARKHLHEHIRRDILGCALVPKPRIHVSVDPHNVAVIQLLERSRIALRSLHERLLVVVRQ